MLGGNLEAKNSQNQTPFFLACEFGHTGKKKINRILHVVMVNRIIYSRSFFDFFDFICILLNFFQMLSIF